MKMRLLAAVCSAVLLASCAPSPDSPVPSSEPAPVESSVTVTPSESPDTASEEPSERESASPTPTPEASPSVSVEPSPEPSASVVSPTADPTTAAPASGWVVVDRQIANDSDADAARLPSAVTQYVKSRLAEPCNLQFNLFAVHPDGFLVGDESGICAGAALFVYGPDGNGRVQELVEFSSVQPCSAFDKANVPTGVPKTRLLPDGLVCSDGGARNY